MALTLHLTLTPTLTLTQTLTLTLTKRGGDVPAEEALHRSSRLRANVDLMRRQVPNHLPLTPNPKPSPSPSPDPSPSPVHALRDALAIARVLNRTLVLPHFDCTSTSP